MIRSPFRLLPILLVLAVACSAEPAPTPAPEPTDAGPRPLDGIDGEIPPPSDPPGYDAGTPDPPTFVPSKECCRVEFKLPYDGDAPGGVLLRGGDAPLTGAGVPMVLAAFEQGVWTAAVCMPPGYASTYHYEVSLPDDQSEGRTFTQILFNPNAPTTSDATLGTVNRFLPAASCGTLDASLHSALTLPTCSAGFTLDEGSFKCVDVDECDRGLDDCDPIATCTNTTGAFLCDCPPERPGDGRTCACPPGEILDNGTCRPPVAGDLVTEVVGGVTLEFSYVPPGTFTMGSDWSDFDALPRDLPPHTVTLTHGFLLLRNELTEAQFAGILGISPTGDGRMPARMPFLSANLIADLLSNAEGAPLGTYRLPTEAEWEYAARAGTTESRYGLIDDIAWYLANSGSNAQPVRGKLPNAWNLYDMLGNVEEWTGDFWGDYDALPLTDPTGPSAGPWWAPLNRVARGGAAYHAPRVIRAPERMNLDPDSPMGLRLARSFP